MGVKSYLGLIVHIRHEPKFGGQIFELFVFRLIDFRNMFLKGNFVVFQIFAERENQIALRWMREMH